MGTAPRKPGNSDKKYTTVYLGQQSGWSTFTCDIKSKYPKIYKKITRSNFYAVPYQWQGNSTGTSSNSGTSGDNIRYDPNTGIMNGYLSSVGPGGTWAGITNYKFYMIY